MAILNSNQQPIIGWRSLVVTQVVNAVDADAQAFITAADITNLTQASAINTLVTDLKSAGVWTKMKALYPMIGGTASSHKWNLKDPRDLDAAFRLVFNGGWTHSSTGALPNGTTGYADTKFIMNQVYASSVTNIHVSYYSRSNTNKYPMVGLQDDNVGNGSQIYIQDNGTTQYYSALNTDANGISINSSSQTIGYYLTSRTSLSSLKGYKNGIVVGSNTTTSTSANLKAQIPIYIGASNYRYNTQTIGYGNKESAFASIGDGLTDTEATAFYTAVQKYQTSLGRHVGTPILADGLTAKLLDTYSGATAAYSLRKIRTEYTENAITVRRSSDNTSQNIGFDANGNLDTTSLLSFVGAGNGFVSVWYDQSGNNKHVVQTTAASQPQIVVNGVVALKNAKPTIDFTSGQFLRCAQRGATNIAVSIFSVLSLKSLSSRGFAWDVGNTSGYQYFALDINTWGTSGNKFGLFISTNSDTDASTNLNQNLITLIAPNTSFATNVFANTRFHLNGTQKNISWGTGIGFPSYGSSIITIGNCNAENVFFNGQQQEFILYPVNQTANRSAIEANINNYYTTY